MSQSVLIGLVVIIGIALFYVTKKSGDHDRAHKMGRKSFKQRTSDKRKLSRHERKLLSQSKQFIAQKRFLQAARLLESIKMERDAITILEKSGHIHEAAHMLLRMRRPNRAGVVYARNSYFTNAAECFIKAGMPLEAAQCARSAGDHKLAAAAFEKVGEFGEAAQSYVAIGAYINAARCYYKANQIDSAMASYKKKFTETENFNYKTLTAEDQSYIATWLSGGNFDDCIATAAKRTDLMTKIINALAQSGHYQNIAALASYCEIPDFNRIMSNINYEDNSAKVLAYGFRGASEHERAGMIFEQLGKFQEAAEEFENARDFERASYLWGRAGNNERSELAKRKQSEGPSQHSKKKHAVQSTFSLGANSSDMATSDSALFQEKPPQQPQQPQQPISSKPFTLGEVEAEPVDQTQPFSDPTGNPSAQSQKSSTGIPVVEAEPVDQTQPFSDPTANPSAQSQNSLTDTPVFELSNASQPNPHGVLEKSPSEIPTSLRSANDAPKSFFQHEMWIDLTGVECQKIWDCGTTISYGKGDIIATEREMLDGIYYIIEGSVQETLQSNSREIPSNHTFGELETFLDKPTGSSYMVTAPSHIRVIKKIDLEDLLETEGAIARKLYKTFTTSIAPKLEQERNSLLSPKVS